MALHSILPSRPSSQHHIPSPFPTQNPENWSHTLSILHPYQQPHYPTLVIDAHPDGVNIPLWYHPRKLYLTVITPTILVIRRLSTIMASSSWSSSTPPKPIPITPSVTNISCLCATILNTWPWYYTDRNIHPTTTSAVPTKHPWVFQSRHPTTRLNQHHSLTSFWRSPNVKLRHQSFFGVH